MPTHTNPASPAAAEKQTPRARTESTTDSRPTLTRNGAAPRHLSTDELGVYDAAFHLPHRCVEPVPTWLHPRQEQRHHCTAVRHSRSWYGWRRRVGLRRRAGRAKLGHGADRVDRAAAAAASWRFNSGRNSLITSINPTTPPACRSKRVTHFIHTFVFSPALHMAARTGLTVDQRQLDA